LDADEERGRRRLGLTCTGRCPEPATHEATYQYVTGKAGRVGTRRVLKCAKHAETYAARYGVTADTTPAPAAVIDAAVSDVLAWMDGEAS
jgi:hypothetical protein